MVGKPLEQSPPIYSYFFFLSMWLCLA